MAPRFDLSRERAEREIAAVNKAIKEGYAAHPIAGRTGEHSAVRVAADALGENRGSFQNRVGSAKDGGVWKKRYGIEPQWDAPPDNPFAIEHDAPPIATSGGHSWELTSNADNTFRFAAFGDLHAGSKYCRYEVRADLTKRAEKFKAQCIFDTGNWIDGEKNFNRYDLEVSGLDNQIRMLASRYPKSKIPTYAVTGADHEGWYVKSEGIDVGRYCEAVMQDYGHKWTNLGYMQADILLKNANTGKTNILRVMHPGGGTGYALSYRPQKIIESMEGGEKPSILLLGHYHKIDCGLVRNVWYCQTGTCFRANARIETSTGPKKIRDIKVGDKVLTHKGRYRKVKKLFNHMHRGGFVSLEYGRINRTDQCITATGDHPILTERGGQKMWVPIKDIDIGDVVFVTSKECPVTKTKMPYWMELSRFANPMDKSEVRKKLSLKKGGFKRVKKDSDDVGKHFNNDILPFCKKMEGDGWRMIPIGGVVIPDAIGIKDGKVVAFEVEKTKHSLLAFKKSKYDDAEITKFVDGVEWIDASKTRAIQPRSWYEEDPETGFVKVLVVGKRVSDSPDERRDCVTVYNFEVDEDNSYIANRVVVHNCQDQTPFMAQKAIEAHVGGFLIECEQDPNTGAIISFTPQARRYFNKGYYFNEGKANDRWSGSGPVKPPPRDIQA